MATTIYKLGSRGDGVSELQAMLRVAGYDVKVDGDYGQRTVAAVRAFQQAQGIGNDGVAGPVTLARLRQAASVGERQTVGGGLTITRGYIYQHITRCQKRRPQYIAIHYTAGSSSRQGQAMQTRQVFLKRQASADFVVDDATVVQINPDPENYYCWAVGDKRNPWTGGATLYGRATNRNTISIEICSTLDAGTSAAAPNHSGWHFTRASLDLTRRLVRHLMQQYGIPRERVVRHYDITGKLCPGIQGWNDGPTYNTRGQQQKQQSDSRAWQEFVASI